MMDAVVNVGIGIVAAGVVVLAVVLSQRIRPSYVFAGVIVTAIFSGNSQYMGLPISVDRVLFAYLLFMFVLTVPRHEFGWPYVRIPRQLWILVAVLVYAAISGLLVGTLFTPGGFWTFLDRVGVTPFALFLAAPYAIRDKRDRRILLTAFLGLGAYLSLTAIMEMMGGLQFVLPRYIAIESIGMHFGRARGPSLDSGANGLALFLGVVSAVIALSEWRSGWQNLAARALLVLSLYGVFLTMTRSAWIGAIAGSIVMMAMHQRTRRLIIPLGLAAALLLATVLSLSPSLRTSATERQSDMHPVWDRYTSNDQAINMVKENPLFGVGLKRFEAVYPEYAKLSDAYPLTSGTKEVHNVLLSRFAEFGIIGGMLWVIAFGWCVVGSAFIRMKPPYSAWRTALVGYATCWIVVAQFTPATATMPTFALWGLAGTVRAFARHEVQSTNSAEYVPLHLRSNEQ